jgi:cytochrome c oxidase cbb3-type subunit 3
MSETNNPDEKLIEGHVYDDIKELDNPLPKWWLITFFATIIFSIFYFGYYQLGDGPSSDQELAENMAEIGAAATASSPNVNEVSAEALMALVDDPDAIALGKNVYMAKCAACHAAEGQGLVGPNLTDKHWIHGRGHMPDLVKVIAEGGRPNKGMLAWKTMLKPEEIHAVSVYVFKMRNTDVPGGKAAEGEAVEE